MFRQNNAILAKGSINGSSSGAVNSRSVAVNQGYGNIINISNVSHNPNEPNSNNESNPNNSESATARRNNSLASSGSNTNDDMKKRHEKSAIKFQNVIQSKKEEKNLVRTFTDDFEQNLQNLSIFTEKAKKRLSTPDKNESKNDQKRRNILLSKSNGNLNLSAMNNSYFKNKETPNITEIQAADNDELKYYNPLSFSDNFPGADMEKISKNQGSSCRIRHLPIYCSFFY